MKQHPILLYDGLCGFCDGAVQFVLRRDRRAIMRFATLQGDFARGVVERHPWLAEVDSLILVEGSGADERVHVRSDGALRVARHLGGGWHVARILRLVPRPLRDVIYDGIARFRYRIFGRRDSCRIPSPEVRARFID
jgi:predicted DCC family thiol-disulfide oxidoreductase YuxK